MCSDRMVCVCVRERDNATLYRVPPAPDAAMPPLAKAVPMRGAVPVAMRGTARYVSVVGTSRNAWYQRAGTHSTVRYVSMVYLSIY